MKKIAGIELRTTNESGRAFEEIPAFWDKFYSGNIIEKIPNTISKDVCAVYTNFENQGTDNQGIYSLIIGCEVEQAEDVIDALALTIIPDGKYKKISVESGNPQKVGETWIEIWNMSKIEKRRSYICDFEHYRADGGIDIYIGLKS